MAAKLIRIIGVGNPLMGDDGVGIKIIELLQQQKLPDFVELVDGGCGGLNLLPLLSDCQQLIVIDAADFGSAPGSIKTLHNNDLNQLSSFCSEQTGHQIGLLQVLQTAHRLKQLSPLTLYLIQIRSCQPTINLTHELESALPLLVSKITKPSLYQCNTDHVKSKR